MIVSYVPRARVVQAIRYDGDNITEIWNAWGAGLVYGPTDHTREIVVTGPGGRKVGRPGDWVTREPSGDLDVITDDQAALMFTQAAVVASRYRPTFVAVPVGTTREEGDRIAREEIRTGDHPYGIMLVPHTGARITPEWMDLTVDGTVVGALALGLHPDPDDPRPGEPLNPASAFIHLETPGGHHRQVRVYGHTGGRMCLMPGGCSGADTVTIYWCLIPGMPDKLDELHWCANCGPVLEKIVDR